MRYSFRLFKYKFDYRDGWLTIYSQVPIYDRNSWIEKHLEILKEDPEDVLTRFTLANNFRMDGQIKRSRLEYKKVVEANHPDWSFLAAKVLREFEGVKDHAPGVVWQRCRNIHLKFLFKQ